MSDGSVLAKVMGPAPKAGEGRLLLVYTQSQLQHNPKFCPLSSGFNCEGGSLRTSPVVAKTRRGERGSGELDLVKVQEDFRRKEDDDDDDDDWSATVRCAVDVRQ